MPSPGQRGWWPGPRDLCEGGERWVCPRYASKAGMVGLLRFPVTGGSTCLALHQAKQASLDYSHLASAQCSPPLARRSLCHPCPRDRGTELELPWVPPGGVTGSALDWRLLLCMASPSYMTLDKSPPHCESRLLCL